MQKEFINYNVNIKEKTSLTAANTCMVSVKQSILATLFPFPQTVCAHACNSLCVHVCVSTNAHMSTHMHNTYTNSSKPHQANY